MNYFQPNNLNDYHDFHLISAWDDSFFNFIKYNELYNGNSFNAGALIFKCSKCNVRILVPTTTKVWSLVYQFMTNFKDQGFYLFFPGKCISNDINCPPVSCAEMMIRDILL